MFKKTNIRIILDVLLIVSVAILPWWLTAFFVLIGIFLFDNFYESFFVAIVVDSIYGTPREIFFGIPFVTLLIVTVSFFFIRGFKKRLRI